MPSTNRSESGIDNAKFVSVETEQLKQELNGLYDKLRECTNGGPTPGLFEYLWDLKELALIEGHRSVQVPTNWLNELAEFKEEIAHERPSRRI